jgi:hypothetical protein
MRGDVGLDDVAAAINGGRYSTRVREPVDQQARVGGQRRDHDGDRFRWKTAETSKGPVLNSLWVIKGIIPRHGTGAMFGRPGGGKTFLATDIGLHVAAGIPWRGHKIAQMEVAYCSMEAGNMGENRIHAWRLHHGRAWPPGFRMTPVMLNFRSTRADAEALAADIKKRFTRVGLVVIDTLSRAMCGGNENSSDDMGALVSHCEWLAAELDCFVLLVHHCGKDEAKGLRGHTSLLGAINTEIEVKRQRGEVGTATITKQRDGADGTEFAFGLERVLLGHDDEGDEVSSCVAIPADAGDVPKETKNKKLSAGMQVALDVLRMTMSEEGRIPPTTGDDHIPPNIPVVKESSWRSNYYLARGSDTADTKRKAYDRAREELQARGFVRIWNEQVWEVRE